MAAGPSHYQRPYGDADRSSMICGGMSKMGKVIRPKMITGYSMLEGKKFFDRWMSGKGGKVYYQDGIWGEYMKANELLKRQILHALQSDASKRRGTGPVNLRFHAEIENGYFTGYEMLHGTHSALGDFEINGIAIMQNNLITYQVQMTWHDIIDPNPTYGSDRISATFLNAVGNPKDYEIHISWSDIFIIGN